MVCKSCAILRTSLYKRLRNNFLVPTTKKYSKNPLIGNQNVSSQFKYKYHQWKDYKSQFSSFYKDWILGLIPTLFLMGFIGFEKTYCESIPEDEEELDLTSNLSEKSTSLPSSLRNAVNLSRQYLKHKMTESGAPGLSVAVSIDGKVVWSEGIGYADVENSVLMSSKAVLRIASISKSLTCAAVCQLIEEEKLDIDAPIHQYVPSYPKKFFNGEEVTITTRQLMNHTSGVRHYKLASERQSSTEKMENECSTEYKSDPTSKNPSKPEESKQDSENPIQDNIKTKVEEKRERLRQFLASKSLNRRKKEKDDEFSLKEYYIREQFESVSDSLQLFQDDALLFKPGEGCSYTTHGWTLVSAVIEGASGKPFTKVLAELFHNMAMPNTYLDKNDPIIYHRSRFYYRNDLGQLRNSPYVDNSYKWAGGGILSTVLDLSNFGNLMLYSYQNTKNKDPKGFFKSSTVKEIWSPSPNTKLSWDTDGSFGLGWGVVESEREGKAFAHRRRFYTSHTGGAIGASSVLLILPTVDVCEAAEMSIPKGIVVSIITNMQSVGLNKTALSIAKAFEKVVKDPPKIVGNIGRNGVFNV